MSKYMILAELNIIIATVFLNIKTLKMIEYNTNVYFAIRIAKKSWTKSYTNNFPIDTNFLTMIT